MADEPVMTPITPEEGGAIPPKANPFGAAPAPAAAPAAAASPIAEKPAAASPIAEKPVSASAGVSTIRLKPVIRKPMIHKPTVGARPPMAPAVAKPAAPAAASAGADAPKKSTQNLKSVTGPIPAQAVLRKTGIIAEGILTPAQQQAAKSKTSRISLESAIGVAPVSESASAPLKTIRLRRPTDLKPQPLKPAAAVAPSSIPPVAPPAAAPAEPTPVPEAAAAPADAGDSSVTQKKTLKLHRPSVGIKRPTMGAAAPAAPAPEGGDVPEIGDIPEIADIKPLDVDAPSGGESAGVPGWVAALSLVTAIAALLVVGAVTYFLYQEGMGPTSGAEVSANEMRVM